MSGISSNFKTQGEDHEIFTVCSAVVFGGCRGGVRGDCEGKLSAYYNENDPDKAKWIRELIKAGIVAPGDVDERSIEDVGAADLRGYAQHHFFAGIAVWSYSLRLAGWHDDQPVCTGSCPCPSFSCAGKGQGFDDPRHLWPHWIRLVREFRPPVIFGEQADDAIGFGWLDLVQAELEAENYAVGKAVLGAASVGAPHIRQRLYFCAHTEATEVFTRSGEIYPRTGAHPANRSGNRSQLSQRADSNGGLPGNGDLQRGGKQRLLAEDCGTGISADSDELRFQEFRKRDGESQPGRETLECRHDAGRCGTDSLSSDSSQRRLPMHGSASGKPGHLALADESGNGEHAERPRLERLTGDVREWRGPGWLDPLTARSVAAAGATRGFWSDCDWWLGRDGAYRPIGPGIFPLAHGVANRVLKLRGYGDAICAETAKVFIEAVDSILVTVRAS